MKKRTYKTPHTYKCRVLNPPIHSTNQLATVQFSCIPGFVGNPYLGHCEGKFLVNFTIFIFSLALYFLLHRFFSNFLPLHGVKINYVTLCDRGSRLHGLPGTCERKNVGPGVCCCICILYHLRNDNCLGVRVLVFFLISSLSLSVHNCLTFVGIGVGFGALFMLIGLWWLYKVFKRRRTEKQRKKYFVWNGGLLLQEQLSSGEVHVGKIKLFTSKELDNVTDHYHVNRMLGQGGWLMERSLQLKKSKILDEGNLRQFINEHKLTIEMWLRFWAVAWRSSFVGL